jgi:hypothetical protein
LAYNPPTDVTSGLLQGWELGEIEQLWKCFRSAQKYFQQPVLIPLFLVELKTRFFAVLPEHRASVLEETKYETGTKYGYSLEPALRLERRKSRVSLDFGPINHELASLAGTLGLL